jgi:hypothetical protein
MMITAIRAGCVDILRVCGMILGGVPDGVRRGVGVAGIVLGGVGGILGGAGVQPMRGRDGIIRRGGAGVQPMRGRGGIIRRGGAGATMRGPAGGWHLLALALRPTPRPAPHLAPPILPATITTTGRVLTLLPAEVRLIRHLGVQ